MFDDLASPTMPMRSPTRGQIFIPLGVCGIFYVACMVLARDLWNSGSAYQQGLAGGPPNYVMGGLGVVLCLVIGGVGVLVNLLVAARFWHSSSRRLNLAMLLFGVLVSCSGLGIVSLRDNSDRAFVQGFRARVKAKVDIALIRAWLATHPGETAADVQHDGWPSAINALQPTPGHFQLPRETPDTVVVSWGGAFGTWELVVGPKDLKTDPVEFHQVTVEVEPGVFVGFFKD